MRGGFERHDNQGMSAREHFDKKADNYFQHVYRSGKLNGHVHNQQVRRSFFRQLLPAARTGTALDVGCGPGSIAQVLSESGWNTHCIDISRNMLIDARRNASEAVSHIQCSAESLCFRDDTFDIVTAAGVLEYVADDTQALREIYRVLRPGGTLIISVPIKSLISTNMKQRLLRFQRLDRFHHKSYTPLGFVRTLRATGFCLQSNISHHFVFFPADFFLPRLSMAIDGQLTRMMKSSLIMGRFAKTLITCAVKPET